MNYKNRLILKSILTTTVVLTALLSSTAFIKSIHHRALDRAIHEAPERVNQYSKSFHIDFSDITKQ
jgi:hypothetical protein